MKSTQKKRERGANKMQKLVHLDSKTLVPNEEVKTSLNKRVIGRPIVKDLKGNILAEEENLVVLGGREFLAQKLTGIANPAFDLTQYKITYFGIGNGGTDGTPPNTVGPFDIDADLVNKVKISTSGVSTPTNEYLYINNGFLKRIESDGSISIGEETHTINTINGTQQVTKYTNIVFNMFIQENEPADKPMKFNEAGLYAVKYTPDGIPTDDVILFARFTTLDKYLDLQDGINIEWNILV